MTTSRRPYFLALAPLVLLAHVAEEAPGLVGWFERHVEPALTIREFWTFSAIGLLVTVALAVPSVRSRNYLLALGLISWLSFLMLANGVVHLMASLIFSEYVPGTVTACILYLPYFAAATVTVCHNSGVRARAAILAAAIGAVPMLAQAISIFTAGRRLLW